MCAPRLQEARVPLTVRPEEAVPRVAPAFPERSVDHDPGVSVPLPVNPLEDAGIPEDDVERSGQQEIVRWSLRWSNATRMSAQDMCLIGPGAALV